MQKKQKQVLYEYVHSQDLHSLETTLTRNLLDLKELMSSIGKVCVNDIYDCIIINMCITIV